MSKKTCSCFTMMGRNRTKRSPKGAELEPEVQAGAGFNFKTENKSEKKPKADAPVTLKEDLDVAAGTADVDESGTKLEGVTVGGTPNTGTKTKSEVEAPNAESGAKSEVEAVTNNESETKSVGFTGAFTNIEPEITPETAADTKADSEDTKKECADCEADAEEEAGDTKEENAGEAEAGEEACPRLVYYRLMVPNWLRHNATWNCTYGGTDLDLDIKTDDSTWENIFRVQILPESTYSDCEDITVKMCIGVQLSEHCSVVDSNMCYMISDGSFAVGFQLNDPRKEYSKKGPYQALEGKVGSRCLLYPNDKLAATVTASSGSNPNQFELRFKPSEAWGSVFCAVDDGHKILAQYSTSLQLSKGLRFEVYRHTCKEEYRINYVEFFVYCDSLTLPKIADGACA